MQSKHLKNIENIPLVDEADAWEVELQNRQMNQNATYQIPKMEPIKPQSQYSKRKWRVKIKPTKGEEPNRTNARRNHTNSRQTQQAKINSTKCHKTTPKENGTNDKKTKMKMKSKMKIQTVPKQERTPMTKCEG